jgi:RNA polymerase sigma-70 factor (ECF subfamily)
MTSVYYYERKMTVKQKESLELSDLLPVLSLAVQGDLKAMDVLLKKTSGYITRRSYSLSGNIHDAQDIAQEVMLRIYNNLSRLKSIDSYFGWQERIIRNAVYDHFRKNKDHYNYSQIDEEIDSAEISSNPMQYTDIEKSEQAIRLKNIIKKLPLREQTAFFLREFEECSSVEIAKLMNIKPASARGLYIKAGKKLAKLLRSEMGDLG